MRALENLTSPTRHIGSSGATSFLLVMVIALRHDRHQTRLYLAISLSHTVYRHSTLDHVLNPFSAF